MIKRLAALAFLAAGLGCSSNDGPSSPADVRYAYVLMGPDGAAIARAITTAATCPAISFDGIAPVQMTVHAAAATIAARTTAYDLVYGPGPTVFPVTTCDATIPAGTARATLGDRSLPLPKAHVRRLLMIGDTGCRMKAKPGMATGEFQACDDPTAWPFKAIADLAASFAPDLVVHVGDFHYRETPCPSGSACSGVTSYGFGWSSWEPDFFAPAERLLAAAPWIVVRGDHEVCDRGGQGWWRFLDPRPLLAGQDCNDPRDDGVGNYSEPYVVPLDDDAVAIVLDTGAVSDLSYDPERAESLLYNRQVQDGFARAAPWSHSIFINHQPILAYNSGGSGNSGTPLPGVEELQGVLGWIYGEPLFPGAVDAILSGHVHKAQITSYSTGEPPTFVTGNGGTNLIAPFTIPLDPVTPYPQGTLEEFTQSSTWGFATMERTGTGWIATYHGQDGSVLTTCSVVGRVLACTK
jgi:hypothetical protein